MINFKFSDHSIVFDKITRTPQSWRQEILSTAKQISDSTDRPIVVSLSGGIDSEVIAKAFLELDIPFSAISFKHVSNTNRHDIQYAERFCKNNNIVHMIEEFSFENFLFNKIEDYIKQGYRSTNIFRYLQIMILEHVEKLGGHAVLGAGNQLFLTANNRICIRYSTDLTATTNWCKDHSTQHTPYFWMNNSELYASYMLEPLINNILGDSKYFQTPLNNGASLEKQIVYHAYWENMERRRKFSGFENVIDLRIRKQKELTDRFPEIDMLDIPVNIIKRQLGID
jgi:hypothetical protein